MRKHQRGVTAIGWLILLIPVAICAYAGIRIGPLYLNYMNVVHSLNMVSGEIDNGTATAAAIRAAVGKHFDVEYISYPDIKDLKITRDNGTWKVEANYDDQAPLFANVAILVTFDKTVKLKGGGGE
jgi:Domain of unknown function (DUF4845)